MFNKGSSKENNRLSVNLLRHPPLKLHVSEPGVTASSCSCSTGLVISPKSGVII